MAAALRAALRGAKVCLIEQKHLGGVCLNVGCIPTKAMLTASDLYWRMRQAEQFGIRVEQASVDGKALMKRVADVVRKLREAAETKAASRKGLDVLRGRGRLTGLDALAVQTDEGEKQIAAESIVIATGSRPVRPGSLSWDSPRLMTSDEAVTATDLPESVIIVGGGVLGCEFATMYSELGIRTHLVEMRDRLLPEMDKEASEAVGKLLTDRGAEVLTGRKVVDMKATDENVTAELDDGRSVQAASALIVVGREANIEDIGLGEARVKVAGRIIPVDDYCRTNVENIYAVGDVAEKRQYAHLAARMGTVAGENAAGHDLRDDRTVVPIGVYTHPEVACVGLGEQQARERFGRVRLLRSSYTNSSAALAHGQMEGQLKILADVDTGRIHGALWIGPHATDTIHELALAVRHGISAEQVYHAIHAHPTFQEAVRDAVEPWVAQVTAGVESKTDL